MLSLPKSLGTAALAAAALAVPAAAQAAPPWSDPVTVPGSSGQAGGAPNLVMTRTRGGAIAWNAPGSFPGTPVLHSVLGGSGPLAASQWEGARDFDTTFGAFAAGDRIIYAGSNGHRRVTVAIAPGPESNWRTEVRGPTTGGARTAVAAAPHGGAAAAFSTFPPHGGGSVYLVRQTGVSAPAATQRVSTHTGSIRAVAVAINASGDVLTAWDRHGTIEARLWYGHSKRFRPVEKLGTVTAAAHLTVALGSDRRAIVAWVDQQINEGTTGQKATVMATARSGSRGFLDSAKQLEAYPDTTIPGGTGIRAAYTSEGRGVIAWSGRTAVRSALVNGRSIGASQDLAPVASDPSQIYPGLSDLVVSPSGAAVVTMVAAVDAQRNQVLAAPLAADAPSFGPAEAVSEAAPFLQRTTASFDVSGRLFVAWQVSSQGPEPSKVELSTRATP